LPKKGFICFPSFSMYMSRYCLILFFLTVGIFSLSECARIGEISVALLCVFLLLLISLFILWSVLHLSALDYLLIKEMAD
jgi:hypothetical protein